jgi:TfoX N-terminal domain
VAYDAAIAERVRRALARRRGVVAKKMMGGICFMLRGTMCCGVTGSAVMIRVGRDGYASALAEPHVRPLEFAGRRPRGFVLVDPPGYRSDAALARWVERSVAVAKSLPAKRVATAQKKPGKAKARPRSAWPRSR